MVTLLQEFVDQGGDILILLRDVTIKPNNTSMVPSQKPLKCPGSKDH